MSAKMSSVSLVCLGAGCGAAGLEAGFLGAVAAGAAGWLAAGMRRGFWQLGHLTVLPANSSLAAKLFPHWQVTLIGMTQRWEVGNADQRKLIVARRVAGRNRAAMVLGGKGFRSGTKGLLGEREFLVGEDAGEEGVNWQ